MDFQSHASVLNQVLTNDWHYVAWKGKLWYKEIFVRCYLKNHGENGDESKMGLTHLGVYLVAVSYVQTTQHQIKKKKRERDCFMDK